MMRRALFVAFLALLACSTLLSAVDVKEYTVRLRIQPDGSAKGQIQLRLLDAAPGPFEVPFGIANALELKVADGPRGTEAVLVPTDGQPRIRITLPEGAPTEVSLSLYFAEAQVYSKLKTSKGKGASPVRLLRHTFVNTREGVIGEYRFEVLLPEGTMAQAIREQLPKPSKQEFEPRVRLGRIEGLQSATLRYGPMRQGDDTTMSLEMTSTRRSWGWLLVGCALALLYLVRFRDLVVPPNTDAGATHSSQS